MDFNTENIDFEFENQCRKDCAISEGLFCLGNDVNRSLLIRHVAAEKTRNKYDAGKLNRNRKPIRFYKIFKKYINSLLSL